MFNKFFQILFYSISKKLYFRFQLTFFFFFFFLIITEILSLNQEISKLI
jgi:hypothetical protein